MARPPSSHTRYRMLGAPSGAVGAANGPQSGSESRISSSILPLNSVAIAGLTLVVAPRDFGCRLHRPAELPANSALTNDHAVAETKSAKRPRIRWTRDDWAPARLLRSEERRVGKECRSR